MRVLSKTTTVLAASTSALMIAAAAISPAADAVTTQRTTSSSERTLSPEVQGPFQIALRRHTVFYTDGFVGTLNKITSRGPRVVANIPGIAGVEFTRDGKTMAVASGDGPTSQVKIKRRGYRALVVPTGSYEESVNPDQSNTYGVRAGGNRCANKWLKDASGSPHATYRGQVDSHPYQLARLSHGSWAVAEAGGNAILRISRRGQISTIAVLPPQPITFTRAQAEALGAPDCVIGVTYAFEPVPTDVERGAHGSLWVSTLPGGPEDPSLGARGSVYQISSTGVVRRIATGFLGATNLAVAGGHIYVAELFNGQVTRIGRGGRSAAVKIDTPLSVEATSRHLYIGTLATGPGSPGKIVQVAR